MREMSTSIAGTPAGRAPRVFTTLARIAPRLGVLFALLAVLASHAAHAASMTLIASDFIQPMTVTSAPGDNSTLYVAQKGGIIYAVDRATGTKTAFLDLSSKIETTGERGLLGFTFDPNFQTNGRFYIDYSSNANDSFGNTIVERYEVSSGNPSVANASSAYHLMTIDQPANTSHKAGWIGFRPGEPSNLYIATGDGAYVDDSTPDPYANAQNLGSNLGKILRVDVTTSTVSHNYGIPADNMTGGGVNPEIWAYGLRNPFRNSFDSATGDFWIADVGFTALDEVNFLGAGTPAGTNFGWPLREGTNVLSDPGATGLTDPLFTEAVGSGAAIIGGFVYHGPIQSLDGLYFFADYINKTIKSYDPATGLIFDWTDILFAAFFGDIRLTSFGEDSFGNMFVTDYAGGRLFGLIASVPLPASLPLLLGGLASLGFFVYRGKINRS